MHRRLYQVSLKQFQVKRKCFRALVSVVKKSSSPKTNLEEISSSSKRKVIKLVTDDSVSKNRTIKSPLLKTEHKEIVKITSPKDEGNDIASPKKSTDLKIKTFDEIMAEKRKRKFGNKEVLVISDDNDSPKTSTKRTLKDYYVNVLSNGTDAKEVAVPVKRARVKRLGSTEEEKAKRRSLQLYKPPTKTGNFVCQINLLLSFVFYRNY